MNIYKKDFPILRDNKIIYLDNAATTQKPEAVIKAMNDYYRNFYASPHRGSYYLSEESTKLYDEARTAISNLIRNKLYRRNNLYEKCNRKFKYNSI